MAAAPVTQKSASVEPEGARLASRIVGFARMLRRAGLRIGPAAVMDAVRAVLSVGIEKRDLMDVQFEPADLEAQMRVKDVFDPKWLLNPAKVFPLGASASRRAS